jgi:pimeloyl-ACP methyl ester carboxylesterase
MNPPIIEPRHEFHPLASGVELHAVHWTRPDGVDASLAPWLLVHGLASNARLWDGVARRLAERGHDVVAIDQRGHGRSTKPDDGYDMITVADDLRLLVDSLGWERPALAGQSWGGNVVLEFAVRHRDATHTIACVDGGFIDLAAKFPDWDDAAAALAPPRLAGTRLDQIEGWLAESAADWPEEGRRGTLANFEVRDDGTIAPWLTFDRHLLVLRGLWEHQPSARYPHVSAPALLIGADTGDVAWSHSKHEAVDAALATLPRGRAEWFSPAHHDVHAQHPGDVADLLHRAVTEADFFPHHPETAP